MGVVDPSSTGALKREVCLSTKTLSGEVSSTVRAVASRVSQRSRSLRHCQSSGRWSTGRSQPRLSQYLINKLASNRSAHRDTFMQTQGGGWESKNLAAGSPESPRSNVPISSPRKTKGFSLRSLVARVGGCERASHATPTPSPKTHQMHKQAGSQLQA